MENINFFLNLIFTQISKLEILLVNFVNFLKFNKSPNAIIVFVVGVLKFIITHIVKLSLCVIVTIGLFPLIYLKLLILCMQIYILSLAICIVSKMNIVSFDISITVIKFFLLLYCPFTPFMTLCLCFIYAKNSQLVDLKIITLCKYAVNIIKNYFPTIKNL